MGNMSLPYYLFIILFIKQLFYTFLRFSQEKAQKSIVFYLLKQMKGKE